MNTEDVKYIAVHCADTPEGRVFTAADIDAWHKLRGFSKIGYHFVVRLDGTIEKGRDLDEVGAHVKGYNRSSIGVCYIGGANGKDTRTQEQKISLVYLLGFLKRVFKNAEVVGHNQFPGVKKTCPNFNPKNEYSTI